MPTYSLGLIRDLLGGELDGNPELQVTGLKRLEDAREGELAICLKPRAGVDGQRIAATALVAPSGLPLDYPNVIRVENSRTALIALLDLFYPENGRPSGIDRRAYVSDRAQVAAGAFIGPGAVVEAGAILEAGVQVHANAYVGEEVVLGEGSILFPGVVLYKGTKVGRRVRIHSNTVIGSDGFGYVADEAGVLRKIPQKGGVEIGNEVEIGANCAIDRATLGVTRVADGTKIDNLVQIAHNVEIGRGCCIVAQVGISGSVTIGDYCVLAGQVGVSDHVSLGDKVVIGAKSGVMRDLESGEYIGYPAISAREARHAYPLIARLPELRKEIRSLEKRLAELEARVGTVHSAVEDLDSVDGGSAE